MREFNYSVYWFYHFCPSKVHGEKKIDQGEGARMADDCSLAPFTHPIPTTLSKDKRLQYVKVEYFSEQDQ